MTPSTKRKIADKNDARAYQDRARLSTTTLTQAQLRRWVRMLLSTEPPHVWLLSGQLGAGKTTLVQVLGSLLGVRGDMTSPTFSLQKIYPLFGQTWKQLVHLDAYRIKGVHEVAALELPEHLSDPSSLVVVEWPEHLPGLTWGNHLVVNIDMGPTPRSRTVHVRQV